MTSISQLFLLRLQISETHIFSSIVIHSAPIDSIKQLKKKERLAVNKPQEDIHAFCEYHDTRGDICNNYCFIFYLQC